jgi:hypothetical protein
MGVYIPIVKIHEDACQVIYHYGKDGGLPQPGYGDGTIEFRTEIGRIALDKETGEINGLLYVSGEGESDDPDDARNRYFGCAYRKLRAAWKMMIYADRIDFIS